MSHRNKRRYENCYAVDTESDDDHAAELRADAVRAQNAARLASAEAMRCLDHAAHTAALALRAEREAVRRERRLRRDDHYPEPQSPSAAAGGQ
jgi:hypothetical protein